VSRTVKMGNLLGQLDQIQPDLNLAWERIMKSSSYIGGADITKFEEAFSNYTGARNCIGVGNGTDAIEIILQSLDLPTGSTVIVPANSFVATAEAVINVGLKLSLVDASEDFGFDRKLLLEALDDSVSAVIAVHLYGYPQDLTWLIPVLGERQIHLIEDCAQAHGAKIHSRHVGTFGVAGAFSFYPGKNLGALGDAGAIITNNPEVSETCRRIANHGRLSKFDHEIRGRNSRLDSLQAAVLSLKLQKLDEWNHTRRMNAEAYRSLLAGVEQVDLPPKSPGHEVYHHFVIQAEERDNLRKFLLDRGIETGIHYPESIDSMQPYRRFTVKPALKSRRLSERMLSLPVAESVSLDDVTYVSKTIQKFFS
jgi:dTDP-4-amino-4,6-dideoxygalactose transaminase